MFHDVIGIIYQFQSLSLVPGLSSAFAFGIFALTLWFRLWWLG